MAMSPNLLLIGALVGSLALSSLGQVSANEGHPEKRAEALFRQAIQAQRNR